MSCGCQEWPGFSWVRYEWYYKRYKNLDPWWYNRAGDPVSPAVVGHSLHTWSQCFSTLSQGYLQLKACKCILRRPTSPSLGFTSNSHPEQIQWIETFPERSGVAGGKESACNAGDLDLTPGSGRSPGEGNGNPLQYSCLENLMDRGAWWATVHGVTESHTTEQLTQTFSEFTSLTLAKRALNSSRLLPAVV